MFIGHFGVAFAAKKVAPETSLGTLILAAQFLDFLWPFFLLLGIEHVRIAPGITRVSPLDFTDYPISHSLLMAIVWAVRLRCDLLRATTQYAECLGGGRRRAQSLGAGLHRAPPRSPVVSGRLGARWIGFVEFVDGNDCRRESSALAPDYGFISAALAPAITPAATASALAAFLFFGWLSTLFAGAPPSVTALAWGGIAMWLTVPWGRWADRHRTIVHSA